MTLEPTGLGSRHARVSNLFGVVAPFPMGRRPSSSRRADRSVGEGPTPGCLQRPDRADSPCVSIVVPSGRRSARRFPERRNRRLKSPNMGVLSGVGGELRIDGVGRSRPLT